MKLSTTEQFIRKMEQNFHRQIASAKTANMQDQTISTKEAVYRYYASNQNRTIHYKKLAAKLGRTETQVRGAIASYPYMFTGSNGRYKLSK